MDDDNFLLPVQVGPISQLIRQPPANSPTKLPGVATPVDWHLEQMREKEKFSWSKAQSYLCWVPEIPDKYTIWILFVGYWRHIWKIDAVKNGQSCPLEEKVFTVPFVLCKLDFFLLPPKVSWKPTIQECWLVDGRRKSQIKVSFRRKRWFARKCCLPGQGGAGLAKSNMMWGGLVSRDCHLIKITHSHVVAKTWNKTFQIRVGVAGF